MEALIPSIEAMLKIFDNLGNRKNRSKAWMKFVIDKLGFEEFARRWEETYDSMIQSGATKLGLIPGAYPDDPPLLMPTKTFFSAVLRSSTLFAHSRISL